MLMISTPAVYGSYGNNWQVRKAQESRNVWGNGRILRGGKSYKIALLRLESRTSKQKGINEITL
jgi:hypothetical protein